ncbi:MAG TPA: (2Fe-2S)-binding protein [Pseudonocardiaceae bacterium]
MPTYTFNLNGKAVSVDAPADMPLLWVLRDKLGVTGPKYGCGVGVCRACTSHINGQAAQICTVAVSDVAGKNVTTIEGLAKGSTLHPVQQAWLDEDVAQCGFCQPGQIMQAAALLKTNHSPTDADIDKIVNVCRCGTYCRIRKAIKRAAASM